MKLLIVNYTKEQAPLLLLRLEIIKETSEAVGILRILIEVGSI
jgi:hypothetical protein